MMISHWEPPLFQVEDKLFMARGGAEAWVEARRGDIERTGGGWLGHDLRYTGTHYFAVIYLTYLGLS